MENRVKEIIASVLDIDIESVTADTSSQTIEQWDSLKQMNLIIALEEEFEIEFSDEEILELQSFSLILSIIKEKK